MTDTVETAASQLETRQEATAVGGEAKYWQTQLALSESDHRDWLKDGKAVMERYKGTESGRLARSNKRFNILFSNTEVLKSALFARMAKPDIRRRFADKDPVGRQIAEIIERSLIYTQDSADSENAYSLAIDDYLLPGRGIVRICYEAETAEGDDKKEYVAEQDLYDQYVSWDDFRHEPAKTWKKVTWVGFRHLMNRRALRENFGKQIGNEVPLNWSPNASDSKVEDAFKRSEVWEIWDKDRKERVWVVNGYSKLLRKDTDPYGLEDFWPMAEPLQSVITTDTFIPRAEFELYRDQADGLDEIEGRIDRLTRALKRRGVYDATIQELKRLSKAADNEFIPVKNYAELTAKGGLASAFQSEDIKLIAEVLQHLHEQRDLRVQTIYEIVGIADIMRGSTDPRETLGAQKIKAQFGGNRLKKRQDKVQKWIRNNLRIKAELIAEHFEPQKLAEMTGFTWEPMPAPPAQSLPTSPTPPMPTSAPPSLSPQMPAQPSAPSAGPPLMPAGQPGAMPFTSGGPSDPQGMPGAPAQMPSPQSSQDQLAAQIEGKITPQMIEILRSDKLRSYRVDIETDSTVFEDAEAEREARGELIKSMSEFVVAWVPVIQTQPKLLPLAFELMSFGVRSFKSGRALEETIEQAKLQLEHMAAMPPPPPPEVQKAQAEAAAREKEMQQEARFKAAELQLEQQSEQQKMAFEAEKHQQEMQFEREKHAQEMQMRAVEAEMARQDKAEEMQFKREESAQNMDMQAQQHNDTMMLERDKAADQRTLKREEMGLKERMNAEGQTEGVSPDDVRAEQVNSALSDVTKSLETFADGLAKSMEGFAIQTEAAMAAVEKSIAQTEARMQELAKSQGAKKRIVRDPKTGRAAYLETVQ